MRENAPRTHAGLTAEQHRQASRDKRRNAERGGRLAAEAEWHDAHALWLEEEAWRPREAATTR